MTELKIQPAPHVTSILAIAAHPDDIESWCAGTLAQSIDAGSTVRLVLVTSGDKGSSDPMMDRDRLAKIREGEATRAAQALGITDVHFLRHEDGDVEDTRALRGELVEWIRRWRPQVVFTHDPVWLLPPYLAHRDHRIVGRVTLDAIYPATRDPLSFSEHLASGLIPHAVEQVWLFASAQADTFVDSVRDSIARSRCDSPMRARPLIPRNSLPIGVSVRQRSVQWLPCHLQNHS
jgi:LmbE family N-acetylglucosaminyl deacetylase